MGGSRATHSTLSLAAPEAMAYYPMVGFDWIENGYIIKRVR